jgi:hypothetical protein
MGKNENLRWTMGIQSMSMSQKWSNVQQNHHISMGVKGSSNKSSSLQHSSHTYIREVQKFINSQSSKLKYKNAKFTDLASTKLNLQIFVWNITA